MTPTTHKGVAHMLKNINLISMILVVIALASIVAGLKTGHGTYGFSSGG